MLDARGEEAQWTLREVVHHVSGVTYYARAFGMLNQAASSA
jgi:hypothetical protein